jgi:ankyrin repeat protein
MAALHFAAQYGYLDILKYLIKNEADVNKNSPKVGTPLILATINGHFDVIQCLVRNNADVNLCSKDEHSALHWAVKEKRSLEILRYLLKNIARVNVNTEIGSPLHCAAAYGNLKMVKILMYHGANVNSVKEENGLSPLHVASKQGHFEVCKYLMTHGANVNEKTKHGFSAYDLAKSNGHILLADFFFVSHIIFLK